MYIIIIINTISDPPRRQPLVVVNSNKETKKDLKQIEQAEPDKEHSSEQ